MAEIVHNLLGNPLLHVASFLSGLLLGHRLNLGRDDRNAKRTAALRFRDAFSAMTQRLDAGAEGFDLWGSDFDPQMIAVVDFSYYLPPRQRRRLGEAADEYRRLCHAYWEVAPNRPPDLDDRLRRCLSSLLSFARVS